MTFSTSLSYFRTFQVLH